MVALLEVLPGLPVVALLEVLPYWRSYQEKHIKWFSDGCPPIVA